MPDQNQAPEKMESPVFARLLALEGPVKGAIWDLDSPRMILGRALECEVQIADISVSRRHCEIHVQENSLSISDLSSMNAVLLNGSPCEESAISPGDRISIGDTVLLVTSTLDGDPKGTGGHRSTLLLAQSAYALENIESTANQGDLTTAVEMTAAYVFSRRLAACAAIDDAQNFLEQSVNERFAPDAYWYVRVSSGEDEVLSTQASGDSNLDGFPVNAVRRAINDKRGILEPLPAEAKTDDQEEQPMALVAPIVFADEVLGCIALRIDPPRAAFAAKDLDFLVALGLSAAPILRALYEVERLRAHVKRMEDHAGIDSFVGTHPSIQRVRKDVIKSAPSDLNVLIQGETGTGKELIARMIHAHSDRAESTFITLNCASIPEHLFESELFGHEKGAFTGAESAQSGLVELADGGTLFLDEIGDLRASGQASLLRFIENGTYYRVGGREQKTVDVRFVAATNKDLATLIQKDEFRSDLFHRLAAFELHIPPLRERLTDLRALVNHFLNPAQDDDASGARAVSDEAIAHLAAQKWPGNVRELRNAIDQGLLNSNGTRLEAHHLQRSKRPGTPTQDSGAEQTVLSSLQDMERTHVAKVLDACNWNLAEAARLLSVSRTTLYSKISKYGLQR